MQVGFRGGGTLFLIADHRPFPGSAADSTGDTEVLLFRRVDGSLGNHPIIEGRNPRERIDSVPSLTGQDFRATGTVSPVLILSA